MFGHSEVKTLKIRSQSSEYEVLIGSGVFDQVVDSSESVIVADSRFKNDFKSAIADRCIFVDALEKNKNLSTVEEVIIGLQARKVRSISTVIAVGGGIIQDLMTMVSSIYMRGIKWIYAPTTLLAMNDSCIGGKSSINTRTVKNLIGNIYPPTKIYIDTDFLKTLSEIDYLCGLAEASKICFCKGEKEFKKFLEFADSRKPDELAEMLVHVLDSKKWFIEIDEFDKAERKMLNFGHTFGHALEVATAHKIPHGLAVASGIKAAVFFESKKRDLSQLELELLGFEAKLTAPLRDLLTPNEVDWYKYADAFKADKKHSANDYVLLLPNLFGGVKIEKFAKTDEFVSKVIEAQKFALSGGSL